MKDQNKRVLLGMSGGTDSSVAAIRLLEAGYDVVGVTFRFYELNDSTEYLKDARDLAARLGIQHITYDAREEFKEKIINYFVREYMMGHTPVPCTLCNIYLKWPLLRKVADELEIYYIATGHYVRKVEQNGIFYITSAADEDKDQSFFLWGLKQEILSRILLPMGDMTKGEARSWAIENGYERIATKRESLGVCFCPMDYRSFLKKWLADNNNRQDRNTQSFNDNKESWPQVIRRGRFVDEQGNFVAWHEGYPYYTIGQRRGLNVRLNHPVFVKEINPKKNEVVLASLEALEKSEMLLKDWNIVDKENLLGHADVIVKIRYRKQENHCTITITEDNLLHVQLHEPLTAIAVGQAAAFYRNGLLLGGGIIVDRK